MAVRVGVATELTAVEPSCVAGLGAKVTPEAAERKVTVDPGICTFTIGRMVLEVVTTPSILKQTIRNN